VEFRRLIEERHSTRVFQEKAVEEEKLQAILHAASRAPSAGDLQSYSIVVARRPEVRRGLAKAAAEQDWLAKAPLILIFVADPGRSAEKYGRRGENLYAIQDATIACAYAQLAAHDAGLAACWAGAFRTREVAEISGVPESMAPVALLAIGYAGESPFITPRRELSEMVSEV
jgi:nitroreductase